MPSLPSLSSFSLQDSLGPSLLELQSERDETSKSSAGEAPEQLPREPQQIGPIEQIAPEELTEALPEEVIAESPDKLDSKDSVVAGALAEDREEPRDPAEKGAENRVERELDDEEPGIERRSKFQLAALTKEAWIFASPTWSSRKIGYLRAGSVVGRSEKPAGYKACKGGWYRVEPTGYVCTTKSASLEINNPVTEAMSRQPDRSQGMPYLYAMSTYPPPTMYVRLPSEEEQAQTESGSRQKASAESPLLEPYMGPVPGALLYDRVLPSMATFPYPSTMLHVGTPVAKSGFGLLQVFEWTGRLFGLSTDLSILPLDHMRLIEGSRFHGVVLEQGLPAAFVRSREAHRVSLDLEKGLVTDAGPVSYREGFALTGRKVRLGGQVYLEVRDGTFIRESERVVLISPMKEPAAWALAGKKWIDVSILRQSLVAYEGTKAVYATLVSTGVDGLGDPKKTHSTIRGAFLIHTKHVTATMSGDEQGDEFDLRDIPYVQYFYEGYAIHGAYWHDEFGTPKSHGCINVAPIDAAWLFGWSEPDVPEGWHGRLQLSKGTLVYVHP